MWELDYKVSWAPKNWCFWTVLLKKTLESPLDCQEIQPVHSEGDQSWVFFGRTDAEAETPVLWPPHAKCWLIGKDWCWEGLGAGGEGDDRGWDGWMASPTLWTWIWVNSGSWWWTGRPGVLQFMGLQRVGHDWVNWTELNAFKVFLEISLTVLIPFHFLFFCSTTVIPLLSLSAHLSFLVVYSSIDTSQCIFHLCLFFRASSSLLNISFNFFVFASILFLISCFIFTVITLNSFLGKVAYLHFT